MRTRKNSLNNKHNKTGQVIKKSVFSTLTVSRHVVSRELLEVGGFKALMVPVHRPHHAGPRLLEHLKAEEAESDEDSRRLKQTNAERTRSNNLDPDQVPFARPLQLLARLVQDGRHHAKERERLGTETDGPEVITEEVDPDNIT